MSLPRAYRLRRRQDFQQVYQRGHRRAGTYMSVHSLAHTRLQPAQSPQLASRFGVVISKKVSKKAVVRNLIKRRIKAAVRQLRPRLSTGCSVVVVCRSAIANCKYDEILRELERLLVAIEVIDGH